MGLRKFQLLIQYIFTRSTIVLTAHIAITFQSFFMSSILLVSPPLDNACEPPASLAFPAGALPKRTWRVFAINLKAQLRLLKKSASETEASGIWRKRAVLDINKLLHLAGQKHNIQLNLSDYKSRTLSSLSVADPIHATESFAENIPYPFFTSNHAALFTASFGRTK